jgi:arginine N-succinyltransferase
VSSRDVRGTAPAVFVRPAREGDLPAILELVATAGYGLTSLPADERLLRRRVRRSVESFQREVETPELEFYLFVLEDAETGRIAGTSGILAQIGGFEPFYAYRLEKRLHRSKCLGVEREVACLHLLALHSGPSEIGALFLSPDYRRHGAGRLISLARFLYMAEEPARFKEEVIAEMRGVVDEHGRSPFWEAVGRRFFDVDFPKADFLSAQGKRFIADLLPPHPIYVPLLPDEARAVLGNVHPETEPALKLLESEGFRRLDWVDIFEGGPVLSCRTSEVRTARESRTARVSAVGEEPGVAALVARVPEPGAEFRVALGTVTTTAEEEITVDPLSARLLQLETGSRIRYAPLRPGGKETG